MSVDLYKREFVVVGELTEDCEYIKLTHHKTMRRLIRKLVGHKLEIAFKKLRYMKSHAQLRWLWGVCYIKIIGFLKNTQGVSYTKEEVHEYNTQYVLNKGNTNKCVVFQEDEFESFVSELITLSKDRDEIEVREIVRTFADKMKCNIQVREVLDKRVVVQTDYKRVSKLSTKGFNKMKDDIQHHWANLGCDIPDPRENNFLTDFIDE